MIFTRRHFGAASLTALAMAGAGSASCAAQTATYRNEVTGYGALRRDPAGFFDLPTGFSYRVISREGAAMADGFITPGKFDGMGCIPLGGNRVALIRNHELKPGDNAAGPSGGATNRKERLARLPVFDRDSDGRVLPGGTTTLVYNLRSRRSEMEYLSLAGTAVNCAGGITPWGSWLSCEETTLTAPQTQTSHGWVFEVPAARRGLADPVPLKAMGRFRHEAAAVDPASGIVYLTEDRDDGLLYRFLPASRASCARAAGCKRWPLPMRYWLPTAATGRRRQSRSACATPFAGSTATMSKARKTICACKATPRVPHALPAARAFTSVLRRTGPANSSSLALPAGSGAMARFSDTGRGTAMAAVSNSSPNRSIRW